MIAFSHAAATDMPFSAMLTIAMVCAAVILGLTRDENTPILPRTPWLALVSFGLVLGLAVLAKGPAAIALCGGAAFFWALFTKRWRDAFRLTHPVAIASFCLTALPWYVLCARRNPDFFRVFIIEHNFKRYFTPEFQHVQPFWFYVPVLLVALLPWTALLLWSSVDGTVRLWRTRRTSASTLFLICWAGFCLAFFTISRSKLPGYVLPAVPAIVAIIAHSTSSLLQVQKRALFAVVLAAALGLGIGGILISHSVVHFAQRYGPLFLSLARLLYLLALSILLLGFSLVRSPGSLVRFILACSSTSLILLMAGSTGFILRRTNLVSLSPNWLASELQHDSVPIDKLRVFRISRSVHYGLNFYLHHEIQDWEAEPLEDGYVLTNWHDCDQLNTQQKCIDLWGIRDFSSGAWALLRVAPDSSVPGAPERRQSQKKE
jgi:4-amino-4-deoxy-L-arabinose transferase-like glycosyltransferase